MRITLVILALLSIVTAACAADGQAFLGMFAETSIMQIAGMPEMPPIPPGIEMPNIPGMEGMMSMGKPVRSFTVRLWSPGIAPEGATAGIVPPEGLKQGNRLDLELYRPKAEKSETGGETGPGQDGGKIPDFTIKYYWGSSATVRPGQPKIISSKSMTAEAKQLMEKERPAARGGSSYFYKPDWTTAYWPTKKQPGKIAKDAALPGKYALTTSYTGNVELDCPPNVDFLAPIKLVSPSLADPVDLSGVLTLKWKPIPNLLGSHAVIMGMEGKDTLIMWSSAEIWRDDIMSVDWGYLQMAEVQQYVKDQIMMPGAQTQFVVPAGIFKESDMASLTMTGYGPGAARMDTQPLPRIQTKTKLTVQLGGKAVGEMK